MIKSRRTRRVELVVFIGDRNACRDLVGNPERKKSIENPGLEEKVILI